MNEHSPRFISRIAEIYDTGLQGLNGIESLFLSKAQYESETEGLEVKDLNPEGWFSCFFRSKNKENLEHVFVFSC